MGAPRLLGQNHIPSEESLVMKIYVICANWKQANPGVVGLAVLLLAIMEGFKKLKSYSKKQMKQSTLWNIIYVFTDMKEMFIVAISVTIAYLSADVNGEPTIPTVGKIPPGLPN